MEVYYLSLFQSAQNINYINHDIIITMTDQVAMRHRRTAGLVAAAKFVSFGVGVGRVNT